MAAPLTRRAFLAGAVALPATRGLARQSAAPVRPTADVVVIGGDPGALAAVYRLASASGLRVVVVQDRPAWIPGVPMPATVAALPPFVRGHAVCFDGWRDRGNRGWGYADVLPSFKRLERYEAGASEHRGADGPLAVSHCWDPHPGHRAFLQACVSGGFHQDSRHDFNGPRSQSVAGYYQKTVRDDRPATFAAAFLEPAMAQGAVAVDGGHVTRILFEGRRAVGVEYARGSERLTVRATRAVVLGAGPARAAQLLMLSGIGPAAHLQELGVPVVLDRAGVGGNLHDQIGVPLRWRALPPAESLPESSVTAGLFTVSLVASPPDLQIDFVDPRTSGDGTLGVDITMVQPTARGQVRLQSTDPQAAPQVSTNPLATEGDVTALVQGIRLTRLVGASPVLDRLRADELAASSTAVTTPDLQAYVRGAARSRGHLAGTCAMGPATDPLAVVGDTLGVHGIDGLHVVGAAVMPMVVNAHPDAAALMVGDRGGEFVAAAGRA
jgi:choline dehydrogenase